MKTPEKTRGTRATTNRLVKLISFAVLTLSSAWAFAQDPAPPGDLRYKVYSSTAAEVFWKRASDTDGYVMAYEVEVNGEVIATLDALSYYFDDLVRDQSYDVVVTTLDDDGNRSAPAAVNFIGGDRSTPTTPDPDDPVSVAAPTGLNSKVYSSRSGEIFWDRPDTFGLTYEVFRDGTLIINTDGVSFYNRGLERGTEYTFEVVAIDPLGNRSLPASVTLETKTSSSSSQPPPATTADTPTGLTSIVYSKSNAEIVWDRPDVIGLSYEISRNGTVVDTTDGVSYYDHGLIAGELYNYEVVAVSSDGTRSEAAMISINTLVPDDEPAPPQPLVPSVASDMNILEPADVYTANGYDPIEVLRVDLRTVIEEGPCNADDESGCTLDDVLADIDKYDDHTVDIKVHFSSDDFPDDGSVSNAELRLRGGGSRFAPQKSFRIKLDSKKDLWRGERHLQLNKHPFDASRIRNKLAMDVMSEIPNLPSMRTQFVNLWIDNGNGPEDYGLFTHVERVNKYYLQKRGWNEDDNVYKAESFRFAKSDLANLAVDENGEPLDEDLFETTLEIERGDDHRMLVEMLNALHDPDQMFESVLDKYFDRDNVMAWVAANILLHQADAVRHNFILYNPLGSEKFYFIPWDYDEAMGLWREPPNDLSNDSLRQRLEFGYALAARNPFLENYYRQPGIHEQILATVDDLRETVVTDEAMAAKANHYINLVTPFQYREPDSKHNPNFTTFSAINRTNAPGMNAEALRTSFGVLMAPIISEPEAQGSSLTFRWSTAYDVTGEAGSVTYRMQVATSPGFDDGTVVIDIDSIDELEQTVDGAMLPTGQYFVRLIATPANDPERLWQVSGNKLYFNNEVYYGTLKFEVP